MNNPYEGFQDLVGQVPEFLQPLIIAVAGAVPYIEGEGSAALGVIAGLNPFVAGIAGATGNIICVILVVLLSSRIRGAAIERRSRRTAGAATASTATTTNGTSPGSFGSSPATSGAVLAGAAPAGAANSTMLATDTTLSSTSNPAADPKPSKGRERLRRWIVRFGVPGASLIGPLALPTQLTAATLVATGVSKSWVILWQVIAIVLWTAAVTAAATGALAFLTR